MPDFSHHITKNLIDFKMLTYPEKKWLAEYHQKILHTIGEELNYNELSWLISKTSIL